MAWYKATAGFWGASQAGVLLRLLCNAQRVVTLGERLQRMGPRDRLLGRGVIALSEGYGALCWGGVGVCSAG